MTASRGFSLLEAVVALSILALAGVAALGAVVAELQAAERARRGLEASALADDRVARIRLLARDQLIPLADSLRRGRFAEPFGGYEWAVSSRSGAGAPELVDVSVEVSWESGRFGIDTRLYRPLSVSAAR